MRVCFVTSEVHPYSKSGGLADVSASLSSELIRAGVDLCVITPLYSQIDINRHRMAALPGLGRIEIQVGDASHWIEVRAASDTRGRLLFVHCPELYDRSSIYTDDEDEHIRFIVLCKAVFEIIQRLRWKPDVLHCHDWQGALIPLFQRTFYAWDRLFSATRTILTIHNIGYQGVFSSSQWPDLVLPEDRHLLHQDDLRNGQINFLKTGILYADRLTTVSPTYAGEIQTPEYGCGLDGLLTRRAGHLTGILNGVDGREWSPSTDPHIPFRYSARNPVQGKRRNRQHLLRRMGLPGAPRPVVGMVSRLVEQKGLDLLELALPRLLGRHSFSLLVLGTGQPRYETFLRELAVRHPEQMAVSIGYDDPLAHLIEAGSDLFLMPSHYEPCGLNQMYSLKYGTVPVVRRTGGLADTVFPFDPDSGEGNGFVFDDYHPDALERVFSEALRLFGNRSVWLQLMRNGMRRDFSWTTRAGEYVGLYRELSTEQQESGARSDLLPDQPTPEAGRQ